jgi:coenzyme F420-0:L-glutamate ligase/coenzyme F420-1:gamma-L-glutamate ligase
LTPIDLHAFLRGRRSIRRFKSDPVPDVVIEQIIATATYVPSAHHRQPWRFAVLTDLSAREKLADAMGREFQRDLEMDGISSAELEKKVKRSREKIRSAPAIVILNADITEMDTYPDERRNKAEHLMATQSVANAGMQLLLAAHAEGLGSVWICSPLFAQETVKRALDLPDTWEPQAMIFLGYADETPEPRARKTVQEITKRI